MPLPPSVFLVFLAGVLTIITPCVLPILPAVLSGSVGSKWRPIAIMAGMSLTFTLMGTLVSALGRVFAPVADYLRWFSIIFIMGMGLVLFDDEINMEYMKVSSYIISSIKSVLGLEKDSNPGGNPGIFGGFTLGMSLGVLWIPCVGPVLGAVLAYVGSGAATTGDIFYGSFLLLVYSMGVSLPMLLIAYSGKRMSDRFQWLVKSGPKLKKLSGLVLFLVGLMLLFEIDKAIQAYMLRHFNWYAVI